MLHTYPEGCPCDRKGQSTVPCPGRLCSYRTKIEWYLVAAGGPVEANFLFQGIAQDHAEYMARCKPSDYKRRNYRSRWE